MRDKWCKQAEMKAGVDRATELYNNGRVRSWCGCPYTLYPTRLYSHTPYPAGAAVHSAALKTRMTT
jgi:hypothetical protein